MLSKQRNQTNIYSWLGGEQVDTYLSEGIWSEILTALTRVWTLVTNFISYDGNHYAKQVTFDRSNLTVYSKWYLLISTEKYRWLTVYFH